MEQECRKYLLGIARQYADIHNKSLTTVSQAFYGTPSFLEKFEHGEVSITLKKFDEVIEAFYNNWPPKLKFPKTHIALHRNNSVKNSK